MSCYGRGGRKLKKALATLANGFGIFISQFWKPLAIFFATIFEQLSWSAVFFFNILISIINKIHTVDFFGAAKYTKPVISNDNIR